MKETKRIIRVLSRKGYVFLNALSVITLYFCLNHVSPARTQSIGYHPQFNFGFNPYTSPLFGYGLGLPFGSYGQSPTRNPWLMNTISPAPYADKHGFISKVHAKAFLKKLASSQALSSGYYGLKDKLNLMKHPEYAYTPYGAGYGYGKHYGAAVVPNNPYKSTYGDFYETADVSGVSKPLAAAATSTSSVKHGVLPIGGRLPESSFSSKLPAVDVKAQASYLKPLIKVGALITTAALLGKKALENPIRLNPSGMILSDLRP